MRLLAAVITASLMCAPLAAQTQESPPPQSAGPSTGWTSDPPANRPAPPANRPAPQAQGGWETGGKYYASYEECMAARKKAEKKGAIIGALVGGGGAALLGGNVGKSALAAGAGALVGSQVAKSGKKC